jgi:hypothetical protein
MSVELDILARSTERLVGSRRRPQPPRSIILQNGSFKSKITWVGPADSRGIVGWRIWSPDENTLFDTSKDVAMRQVEIPLASNQKVFVAVSSFNALGRDSQKVPAIASSNADLYDGASSGTNPVNPPDWPSEPQGGCVVEGTIIEPLGDAKMTQEVLDESTWIELTTENGCVLRATKTHPVFTEHIGKTPLSIVHVGDMLVTKQGSSRVIKLNLIYVLGKKVRVQMESGHLFWANGILSHNVKNIPEIP